MKPSSIAASFPPPIQELCHPIQAQTQVWQLTSPWTGNLDNKKHVQSALFTALLWAPMPGSYSPAPIFPPSVSLWLFLGIVNAYMSPLWKSQGLSSECSTSPMSQKMGAAKLGGVKTAGVAGSDNELCPDSQCSNVSKIGSFSTKISAKDWILQVARGGGGGAKKQKNNPPPPTHPSLSCNCRGCVHCTSSVLLFLSLAAGSSRMHDVPEPLVERYFRHCHWPTCWGGGGCVAWRPASC